MEDKIEAQKRMFPTLFDGVEFTHPYTVLPWLNTEPDEDETRHTTYMRMLDVLQDPNRSDDKRCHFMAAPSPDSKTLRVSSFGNLNYAHQAAIIHGFQPGTPIHDPNHVPLAVSRFGEVLHKLNTAHQNADIPTTEVTEAEHGEDRDPTLEALSRMFHTECSIGQSPSRGAPRIERSRDKFYPAGIRHFLMSSLKRPLYAPDAKAFSLAHQMQFLSKLPHGKVKFNVKTPQSELHLKYSVQCLLVQAVVSSQGGGHIRTPTHMGAAVSSSDDVPMEQFSESFRGFVLQDQIASLIRRLEGTSPVSVKCDSLPHDCSKRDLQSAGVKLSQMSTALASGHGEREVVVDRAKPLGNPKPGESSDLEASLTRLATPTARAILSCPWLFSECLLEWKSDLINSVRDRIARKEGQSPEQQNQQHQKAKSRVTEKLERARMMNSECAIKNYAMCVVNFPKDCANSGLFMGMQGMQEYGEDGNEGDESMFPGLDPHQPSPSYDSIIKDGEIRIVDHGLPSHHLDVIDGIIVESKTKKNQYVVRSNRHTARLPHMYPYRMVKRSSDEMDFYKCLITRLDAPVGSDEPDRLVFLISGDGDANGGGRFWSSVLASMISRNQGVRKSHQTTIISVLFSILDEFIAKAQCIRDREAVLETMQRGMDAKTFIPFSVPGYPYERSRDRMQRCFPRSTGTGGVDLNNAPPSPRIMQAAAELRAQQQHLR